MTMITPGIKSLGDFILTGAGEQSAIAADGFEGVSEIDAQIAFLYGNGGADARVYLQTSLDQGASWIDLWCLHGQTASKTRARRLKPDGNEVTPTNGALADDAVAAGIVLGDRFRALVRVTGASYGGGTAVSVRISAR